MEFDKLKEISGKRKDANPDEISSDSAKDKIKEIKPSIFERYSN